jgi:hypothetical protein
MLTTSELERSRWWPEEIFSTIRLTWLGIHWSISYLAGRHCSSIGGYWFNIRWVLRQSWQILHCRLQTTHAHPIHCPVPFSTQWTGVTSAMGLFVGVAGVIKFDNQPWGLLRGKDMKQRADLHRRCCWHVMRRIHHRRATALVLNLCWTVCGQSNVSHPLSRVIRTPCGQFRVRFASALLTITMVLGRKSIMVTLFTRAAFYVGTSMFPVGRLMGDQSTLRQRDPRKSAAEAISLAPRRNWQPLEQRRQGKASAMVSDGSCGHRPMIWRPSDMVPVVDRWLIVVLCVKKYGTFVRSSQKN